jgi:hypothetical protein
MHDLRTYDAGMFGRQVPIFQRNMLFPSSFDGIIAQRIVNFNYKLFSVERN